jgi:crotonobetaine/carnitine-CoA ligase
VAFRGRTWSYAEAGAITDAVAAELLALGVGPGDRLAMRLPTGPEHVFLWLATAKAGIVSCPLHVDLAPPEIDAALAHLAPRGLVDASGSIVIRGAEAGRLSDLMASRRALSGVAAPKAEAIATILTTSGTTGRPKCAMLSHRMAVLTGEGFGHWLGLTAGDRLFTCLPLSHINARFYSTLGAIAVGASLALEERFSASRFWSSLREAEATEANAIGAMLKILLDRPEAADDRDHSLRLVYAAPALGREAHLEFERRFGARLVIGYGLTESTFGFIQPAGDGRDLDAMGIPRRHPDSVGPGGGAAGGRRDLAAQSRDVFGVLRRRRVHSRRSDDRRVAQDRRSRHAQRRRELHVRRTQEARDPPARRDGLPRGGGSGARSAPGGARSRRSRRPVAARRG